MEDPKVLFGHRLRYVRQEKGWSQEKLASECELDRTYIGGVERGERNIALINICKIASALEIPPDKLLAFSDLGRD
jgi:transcriptional regulator with XRE-family HTH domain